MPETLTLQDGNDAILLTHAPACGCIHLKTVDKNGFTIRRDILPFSEHPELECLHSATGWYYPLIGRALELYTGCKPTPKEHGRKAHLIKRHIPTLPAFVSKHYGRAL